MGVIWSKIWFDIWHNKLRTGLVILSITVGVFAVGMTFGMVEQLLPAMDQSHQSTFPSHGTIYLTQPIDEDTITALLKVPGVESIEPTNTVAVRYKKQADDPWRKAHLLQRADYENQTYDVLELKQGSWPESRLLGIERMHSPHYDIKIGDQVIIEIGDRERVFEIGSVIRHPFVPPPSMYDLTWFFADEDTMELFGIEKGHFSEIKFRASPYSPENVRKVAGEIKNRLANQGFLDSGVVYQDPKIHWGRFFVDGISLVLQVLAVLSMLLSVVLVLNTLTAVITQQTNQIGILKAIGGSKQTITKIYLVGTLFYGVAALLIAFPIGSITAFRITQWFLALYNIEYDQFTYSTRVLWIQAFAAVAVPLLASLYPILKGAAITVRQAISSYGIGGDFGFSRIDRWVETFGRRFLLSYQAIALANMFRRKGRLVLTQLVLIISGLMFLMVMGLSSSINATLDHEFDRYSHDVIITFGKLHRIDFTSDLAQSVRGVAKADMWIVIPAAIFHQGSRRLDVGIGSVLQGIPLDDPMYQPYISEGRWLQPGDDRMVVMSKETADDENLGIGDKVVLDLGEWGKTEWTIVGLYRTFQLLSGGGFGQDTIYAPREAVCRVTKKVGRATTLLVRTSNSESENVKQISDRLQDQFKQNHIEISSTETINELRQISDSSFSIVIMMLLVLAVIVAIVGGIGLMGSLWISVIERTKEIGIIRAIGGKTHHITGMFILEAVFQGILSWVVAFPIALVITPLVAKVLGQTMFKADLEYQFNFQAVLIWLVIVLLISLFASLIPARNAAQINVRQSLTYE